MSESGAVWKWFRLKRPISTRRLVFLGLALCAAIAVIVRIAVADGGDGMMLYTSERGQGPWTEQHYYHNDKLSLWESVEERYRRFLGLSLKTYYSKREIGELQQVSTADVPYLTIPQLARFLPSNRGWSFQILVYNSPRPITDNEISGAVASETRGRFCKATIKCMHASTPSDFRTMTDPRYFGGGMRPYVDMLEYFIHIDENGHAFRMTRHEVGAKVLGGEPPLDLGDMSNP